MTLIRNKTINPSGVKMEILLANPRGFCAGVDRAIEIVERALALFDPPIYVRHEVVHNRRVVDDLKRKGAIFVEEIDEVPPGSIVIFSAHGVAQDVRRKASQQKLRIFDATCPLVTKVHMEVARYARQGYGVIMIGHRGHPEVEGTMGQYITENDHGGEIHLVETPEDAEQVSTRCERIAYVTQTTLSVTDTETIISILKRRIPPIEGPKKNDICYATQNRQDAVRALAEKVDVVLVVGSFNSSNSNRLREIAGACGAKAYMADNPADLQWAWFIDANRVGITAGASAPETLVQSMVKRLEEWGCDKITESEGRIETVHFPLPQILRRTQHVKTGTLESSTSRTHENPSSISSS